MSFLNDVGAFVSSDKFGDTLQSIKNTIGGVKDTLGSLGVIKTSTPTQTEAKPSQTITQSLNDAWTNFKNIGSASEYALPITIGIAVIAIVMLAGKTRS